MLKTILKAIKATIVTTLLAGISHAACDSTSATTPTTRAGLAKPVINACGWGVTTNANWDIIDSSAAMQGKANTFTSTQTFSQPVVFSSTNPVKFYDTSTHYLSFRASNTVTTTNFVFPDSDGSNGQFLRTNGAGNWSWGSAPGGASTLAVQKNAVNVTSPTVAINMLSPPFNVTLVNGSTSQVSLDASSVTLQGNTFNQASKLVQLDASSKLPAVDGSQLTNLPGGAGSGIVSPGTFTWQNTKGITVSTLTATSTSTLATTYITSATVRVLSVTTQTITTQGSYGAGVSNTGLIILSSGTNDSTVGIRSFAQASDPSVFNAAGWFYGTPQAVNSYAIYSNGGQAYFASVVDTVTVRGYFNSTNKPVSLTTTTISGSLTASSATINGQLISGPIVLNEDSGFVGMSGYAPSACANKILDLTATALTLGDTTGSCGTASTFALNDGGGNSISMDTGQLSWIQNATVGSSKNLNVTGNPVNLGNGTYPMTVYATSATVTGSLGLRTTYGTSVGSITIRNIASGNQCLHADANGLVSGTGSDCGTGGGGSSSLEVMANSVRVTSPTATASFLAGSGISLTASAIGGTTAQITITATGGGGGGYNVQPATVTFQLDKGVTASTLTVTSTSTLNVVTASSATFQTVQITSNTILGGATIYANGILKTTDIRVSGLGSSGGGSCVVWYSGGGGQFGTTGTTCATDRASSGGSNAIQLSDGLGTFTTDTNFRWSTSEDGAGANILRFQNSGGSRAGINAHVPNSGIYINAYSNSTGTANADNVGGISFGLTGSNWAQRDGGVLQIDTTGDPHWTAGGGAGPIQLRVAASADEATPWTALQVNATQQVLIMDNYRNCDLVANRACIQEPSAVLEATSTTRGFLPPRMTTTQKNAIASPAAGLLLYDTTLATMTFYNGSAWQIMGGGGGTGTGGSGIVSPGTFTWTNTKGISVSTLTVTSTATIQSLTTGTSTFALYVSSDTLAPNAALANSFYIPLASSCTINGPLNPTDGQSVVFIIKQDAATRLVTWASGAGNFSFGTDLPSLTLSAGGNKYDIVGARYNATIGKWLIVSLIRGYT